MKKKLPFIALLASTLLLAACDDIFGILTVDNTISLKGNKTVSEIEPGRYAVEIEIDKDHFDLKFESGKVDDNRYFRFNVGRDELPGENEILVVDAEKAGQPYDLNIENTKETTESETVEERESCTGSEIVEVCRFINGRYVCTHEFRSFIGQRDVIYLERTETRTIISSLLDGENTLMAAFKAESKDTNKVYQYEGRCFR